MLRSFRYPTLRLGACAFVILAMPGLLLAAPADPKASIAVRQAGFKKMGAAFKIISDQLKTDAPAKDQMAAAARTLAATARPQPTLFPPGSGPGHGVPTDALLAVWSDRATFDAQMAKLVAQSNKLVAVTAGGDIAAIRVQAKATGDVCSGCHRQFRADD